MKKGFLVAAIMVTAGTTAFAQLQTSDSVEIRLYGRVAPRVVITASVPDFEVDMLADADDVEVATITEWSNVRAGYQVTLASVQEGRLVNRDDSSEVLPYTVTYDGVTWDLSEGAALVTDRANEKSVGPGTDRRLGVNFVYDPDLGDGEYDDDLIFTITAN
ncbi:hypothetical protein SAMN05920897_11821 [Alkalispirochaeta americana]|uniref:Uncharacterized protein n=1 Tax=Alkalispirochaeta americana TaxID=159291 RepID=A0A1N6WNF0_9SPIO|nr:hypothetical protein [Alkalispirochaeta americana]SIQ91623.1 hypothetical protein SAMN05920897_11821 [Alkalispirochaeta americana]